MENVLERARELGRHLGQSDEYRSLERARERFSEDREAVGAMEALQRLEREIGEAMQRGEEPDTEKIAAYERSFGELQSMASYQGLVAAQSNFDKILGKVNDAITKGIDAGARSRIILPS